METPFLLHVCWGRSLTIAECQTTCCCDFNRATHLAELISPASGLPLVLLGRDAHPPQRADTLEILAACQHLVLVSSLDENQGRY